MRLDDGLCLECFCLRIVLPNVGSVRGCSPGFGRGAAAQVSRTKCYNCWAPYWWVTFGLLLSVIIEPNTGGDSYLQSPKVHCFSYVIATVSNAVDNKE